MPPLVSAPIWGSCGSQCPAYISISILKIGFFLYLQGHINGCSHSFLAMSAPDLTRCLSFFIANPTKAQLSLLFYLFPWFVCLILFLFWGKYSSFLKLQWADTSSLFPCHWENSFRITMVNSQAGTRNKADPALSRPSYKDTTSICKGSLSV